MFKVPHQHEFTRLPPSSFSEMSPVCFRPAFDEMDGLWLTRPASWHSYRWFAQALVWVQTPAPFHFQNEKGQLA